MPCQAAPGVRWADFVGGGGLLWYHGHPRGTPPVSEADRTRWAVAQGQTPMGARRWTYDGARGAKAGAVDRGASDE
jgi:hypothetical protein